MYTIDLHTHSTMSDGTLTPRELAFYAKAKGLFAIALTDHDTTAGIAECIKAGNMVGLKVIPGIEISCKYHKIEIHLLGYYIDIENQTLQDVIAKILNERKARNVKMIERLTELGYPITMKDLNPNNDENMSITRGNVAGVLLEKGYFANREEVFEKCLRVGQPGYVEREFIDYKEAIAAIVAAGGVAVIAHPYFYKLKDVTMDQFILDLKNAGLAGIETIYPEHSKEKEREYLELCEKYGLFLTGGTDYHGDNKPNLDIGNGFGKTSVPKLYLDVMEKTVHFIKK